MPGPVSDSYDPEFGTREVVDDIDDALRAIYDQLTKILGGKAPRPITELIDVSYNNQIGALLTEKEWRMLQFAVERARDSLNTRNKG